MWFGVSLLFRSSVPLDEHGTPLFEERIILLAAHDEAEAWKKAKERAPGLEEQYINAEGHCVTWTFERPLDVQEIPDEQLEDGVEVFHRFLREDEVHSLGRSITQR